MRPSGTVPKAVIETLSGPGRAVGVAAGELAAERRLRAPQAGREACRARRARALPGSASDHEVGERRAPLAARSETLTASAFQAIAAGSSSGRKCTPAMTASVVTTSSCPGGGAISRAVVLEAERAGKAGRQRRPELGDDAPLRSADHAGSWSRRHRRSNSAGAQPPRQLVEHAVDDLRLLVVEERVRDVDVLVDDDAGGHVGALHQLEHAGAQDRAQDGVDAHQPPARRQLLIDERIDVALAAHDAAQELGEERRIGAGERRFVARAAAAESAGARTRRSRR